MTHPPPYYKSLCAHLCLCLQCTWKSSKPKRTLDWIFSTEKILGWDWLFILSPHLWCQRRFQGAGKSLEVPEIEIFESYHAWERKDGKRGCKNVYTSLPPWSVRPLLPYFHVEVPEWDREALAHLKKLGRETWGKRHLWLLGPRKLAWNHCGYHGCETQAAQEPQKSQGGDDFHLFPLSSPVLHCPSVLPRFIELTYLSKMKIFLPPHESPHSWRVAFLFWWWFVWLTA